MNTKIFNDRSRSGLVVALVGSVVMLSFTAALAQVPPKKEARTEPKPPWQRVLQADDAKRVEALEKMLEDLEKKGQFAEAVAPAREVLVIRRRVQGEDHWQTVNARITEQTFARVAGMAREAQSELAAALRQQGEADQLYQNGRYTELEHLVRAIWEVHRRILGEDHPNTVLRSNNLATNLRALGRYAEAEPLLQKVLAVRRKTLGEDHPYTALSCNNLAIVLDAQGKSTAAEPLYQKALAIRRKTLGKDHSVTASSYDNLAYNRHALGKHAEAEPLFQEALAIRRKTLGEDHYLIAYSYNNLAANLDARGKYAEAEPLFQKALAIRRKSLGEDHSVTASSYDNLAVNLRRRRKYAEAEPLFQKALAIRRKTLGEDHPETATSYGNLATSLDSQGKHAEAEPAHQKALTIRRKALGEDHPETAKSYDNLAMCLDDRGKHSEAEPLFRKALTIRRLILGEGHGDTASSYNNLAHNLLAQGRYPEAEAMALAAARSYEAARLRISFAGLGRAEFASKQSPLPLVAAILAQQGRDRDAWQRWESGLARGLSDDLEARRSQRLTPDERRRREDLIGQLNRLDNQIGTLAIKALTDDQRKRVDELKNQRLELQGRLAQLESELVRKYRVTAGAIYALDQIQAQLPADVALVGWLDLQAVPNPADPRGDHWAFVLRHRGAPRLIRTPGTGPDRAWTQADDQRSGQVRELLGSEDLPTWQESLAALAAQRLAPLEDALAAHDGLPAVRHLIVLPSPALAGIPVEALLEARPAGAPRYFVSYAPSGTLFAWLQERRREDQDRPARPRRLLALGDPVPPPADAPAPKPPDQGLLVQKVEPGSNADQAGIRPGDVLLQYAGAKLAALDDLQKQVQAGDPKAKSVAVAVWREGTTLDLTLKPGPLGVGLNNQPAAAALLARARATPCSAAPEAPPSTRSQALAARSRPSPGPSTSVRSTSAPTPANRPWRPCGPADSLAGSPSSTSRPTARSTTSRR